MDNKGLKEDTKGYPNNEGIHILAIGVADERYFSRMDILKKGMSVCFQLAKRHAGFKADEWLKPLSTVASAQTGKQCSFRSASL